MSSFARSRENVFATRGRSAASRSTRTRASLSSLPATSRPVIRAAPTRCSPRSAPLARCPASCHPRRRARLRLVSEASTSVALPAPARPHRYPGASNPPKGGETAARPRLSAGCPRGLPGYDDTHDDLAVDGTSGLSPYLHFGCLSPPRCATARREPGGEAFVRQLCWRDFHHQVLAARPDAARGRTTAPRRSLARRPRGFAAWKEGRTGYPLVDAGMRQLRPRGLRCTTAPAWSRRRSSSRTSTSTGASGATLLRPARRRRHRQQPATGSGSPAPAATPAPAACSTRPQARRFDPDGDYVRRYVPELDPIEGRRSARAAAAGPPAAERLPGPDRRP